jgi:hypothetical protein
MPVPNIEPYKCASYDCKQSKYEQAEKVPFRSLMLGPSGSGKGVLLQRFILDIYRDSFERIYLMSPSIHNDHTWNPVKKYIKNELRPKEDEEYLFDSYNPEELEKIITRQHKVVKHLKEEKQKQLYSILICIDDFADTPEFMRNGKLLHQLYIRGRHDNISVITATQLFKARATVVRKNITGLYVFRLRNASDLDAVMDEVSALANKKTLLNMYDLATKEPHSFMFINFMVKDPKKMFMIKYQSYLQF